MCPNCGCRCLEEIDSLTYICDRCGLVIHLHPNLHPGTSSVAPIFDDVGYGE